MKHAIRQSRTSRVVVVALAGVPFACGGGEPENGADQATPTPSPAASATPSADRDMRELADYELSMDAVTKWAAANKSLAELAEKRPELEEQGTTNSDNASLDDMVKRVESIPEMRAAIEKEGLSAREYALVSLAVMQSAVAQMALAQGVSADSIARQAGINKKNLTFYQEHKAELERIFADAEKK